LGDSIGFLSVAIGWAVGYPIAFIALGYLVIKAIRLPVSHYLRAAWGIVGCCLAGFVAGLVIKQFLDSHTDGWRMLIVAITSLVVTAGMMSVWQGITPRSISRTLKG